MFLSLFQAAGPDRSPYGDFWFEPIGGRSASGQRITADGALRLTAVWACVRILSETLACHPLQLSRPKAGGGSTKITDHPLLRLFNLAPNSMQTPFEWREMLQAHLVLRGNAYNQIVTNGRGEITALVPMHPDRMKPEMLPSGDWRYRYRQPDGRDLMLTRGEVWHLRGMSFDGILGLNPIELARDAIGIGLSAQEYGARFFHNDARPGAVIEFKGTFKDASARDTFKASWQLAQSGVNRGKTAVLEHDMQYKEIGLNNADAQFIETRKLQVTEIARLFRVPPHMIADLERSTNNNIEHQGLEFVLHTMTPWAERWESSVKSNLLLEGESDIDVKFDFTSLLRGDHASRAAFYTSAINAGWLTRNEARDEEGRDPLPGLDVPLQPLNMVPAGTLPQDLRPGNDGGSPKQPGAPVPGRSAGARHFALVQAVATRVARKEWQVVRAASMDKGDWVATVAAAYEAHAPFVAACLNVPMEAARAYCASRVKDVAAGVLEQDFMAFALSKLERLALDGSLE